MGRLGGDDAGNGKVLVRAVKYDKPKDLPGWIAKRITQLVMTSDGKVISRTGYLATKRHGGKVRWSGRWHTLAWKLEDFHQSVDRLDKQGFILRKAADKVIKAALVFHRMQQE